MTESTILRGGKEGGAQPTDRYTYQVWFTEDVNYPWHWAVRMNGHLLGKGSLLGYTGTAVSKRQARRKALRYIRRHKKHFGYKSPEYRA